MAIVTTQARTVNILTLSYQAYVDLSDYQYCAVAAAGAATGKMEITSPSGQGVWCVGILQTYNCDEDTVGEVMVEGVCQAKINATLESGIELAVSGTTGELGEAATGDYVIAIAEEACVHADQIITVRLVSPYQKN